MGRIIEASEEISKISLAWCLLTFKFAMENKSQKMGGLGWVIFCLFFYPVTVGAYEGVTVSNGGTIKGVVQFQGEIPQIQSLPVFKFKEVCRDVPDESLVVGLDFGLRYAVVTLEGIAKGEKVDRGSFHELDNRGCRFVPHVLAASVGQQLVVKNSDPILHAVHVFFNNKQPEFNLGLYPGKVRKKPLASSGVAKVLCEVHPWMIAYIVVTDHPYHAVTDIFGEYELRNVPPGTYRLKVWHESLGIQVKEVVVKGKAVSKVSFLYRSGQGGKE